MDSEKKKHFIGFSEVFFAVIAAVIFTIGRCIYISGSVFTLPSVLKEYSLIFLVLFIPFLFIFTFAGKGVKGQSAEKTVYSDRMMWLLPVLSALLIAAACVVSGVCLRSYFVGSDAVYYAGSTLIPDRYPVIHTLLRQLFRYTGSSESFDSPAGIAFLAANSLMFGATCGYDVRREMSEGFRKLPLVLSILYFTLFVPFLAADRLHSEEGLFFCAVMMLLTSLAKADRDEENSGIFVWLFLVMACLLRYNFIVAAFVLCISLLLKIRKKGMKNCIIASLFGITTVIAIILAFFYGFGLVEIQEKDMMSVPAGQVAAVYADHTPELTIAEKFIIENYMSLPDNGPQIAEYVMNTFNEGLYLADRSAFWDLYLHLARKYPYNLIEAFLFRNSRIYQPGVMGIPLFMIILGIYIALKSKRPGYSAGITALSVLWLTYLFGPVPKYHYLEAFNMLIPAVLLPVFAAKPASAEDSEDKEEDADDGILDDDELMKEIEKMESEEKGSDKKGSEKKESDKKNPDKKESDKKGPDKKETEKKGDQEKKEPDKKETEKKDDQEKKESDKKETEKPAPKEQESEKKGPVKEEPEKEEPEKKEPEKEEPVKEEPEKKEPEKEEPVKEEPEKKEPEKEEPEKEEPEKEEPEKKEPEKEGSGKKDMEKDEKKSE